jgi:peptide/nickel transport system substrate-binding protein
MTSRLSRIGLILALFSGTILIAGAEAKTLRWAFSGDVATLDPYAHAESFTSNFLHHIYDPLVRRSKTLEIEPALATSWETIEPSVVRFKLRQGVKFHNGNPFNADDVIASTQRLLHPDARARGNLATVQAIRKVDDLTVDFVLKGPYPLLLNDLTGIFIMDKEWLEANNAVQPGNIATRKTTYASTNANGTGPFRLESYQADSKTVLTANPDWWDKAEHNLTRIEFRPVKSDATRVAALFSSEIDLMFPAPLQDLQRITSTQGFQVIEEPSLRVIFLGLNHSDPELRAAPGLGKNPMKDLKVRQALWHAIDLDAIQKRIMRGKSRNTGTLVAPPVPGYDPANDQVLPFDPKKAKELLAEAGYPKGFKTGLDCPNDRYVADEAICVAIASMWAQVGVETDLVIQSKTTYFPKVDRSETDAYMLGWSTLPPMDGSSVLSALLASRKDNYGGNNPNGYFNETIEQLTRQSAVELDEHKRRGMLKEALKIARNDVAYIPLHAQPVAWAARKGVSVKQYPDEFLRLWWDRVE